MGLFGQKWDFSQNMGCLVKYEMGLLVIILLFAASGHPIVSALTRNTVFLKICRVYYFCSVKNISGKYFGKLGWLR